jgi:Domain of Unknown Function (DUF1080)
MFGKMFNRFVVGMLTLALASSFVAVTEAADAKAGGKGGTSNASAAPFAVYYRSSATGPWLFYVGKDTKAAAQATAAELTDLGYLTKIMNDAELAAPEGWIPLFNGKDLTGWKVLNGKMDVWGADADRHILYVEGKGGGWLMTEEQYGNFEAVLDFKMAKRGDSGVALRAPFMGSPASQGMEVQLLDDENYKGLRPAQYTGSIYDVIAPSERVSKSAGEWQNLHIIASGRRLIVELNGTKVIDANLDDYQDRARPGLLRASGLIGLQSNEGRIEFRNLFVRPLNGASLSSGTVVNGSVGVGSLGGFSSSGSSSSSWGSSAKWGGHATHHKHHQAHHHHHKQHKHHHKHHHKQHKHHGHHGHGHHGHGHHHK